MLTSTQTPTGVRTDNSWSAHYRASIALGVPFVGAQLAQFAIHATDVLMVGRLGTTELAAMVLAAQMFFTVFIFGSGFANAVVPIVAQAQGGATASPFAVPCAWACGRCSAMAC